MLRWVIRAAAANRYRNKVISESSKASRKSKDAVRSFNRAKREKYSAFLFEQEYSKIHSIRFFLHIIL